MVSLWPRTRTRTPGTSCLNDERHLPLHRTERTYLVLMRSSQTTPFGTLLQNRETSP